MAAYDDDLSGEVSLSRVLDELIRTEESPEIVANFLKKYDCAFSDIAARSMLIGRVYFAGYLQKCKLSELEYFLSHLDSISPAAAERCLWQCLACKESFAGASSILKKAAEGRSRDRHPYAGYGHSLLKPLDKALEDSGFSFASVLGSVPPDELACYLSRLEQSLYSSRILQLDVYEQCSPEVKYLLISKSDCYPIGDCCSFFKQLLTSQASAEEKLAAYMKLRERGILADRRAFREAFPSIADDGSLLECIDKASSYPQIAVKLLMHGEDAIADSVFYMLAAGHLKVLAEMAEQDAETMQSNFPVNDLVKHIASKTSLIEQEKHGRP